MSGHRQYKITDYRFGLLIVALREKAALTQKTVGDALNVSRRTIQHWEAGTAFPDTTHLKNLIAFYMDKGVFTAGSEKEETLALWVQADESAARRKNVFDEKWFASLQQHTTQPAAVLTENLSRASTQSDQPKTRIDWGDAPDAIQVVGREPELAVLSNWVLNEHCRLVAVLGMAGIGKTTLAVKFAQDNASQFDYIIWRSLRNAPALEELLAECFQILSPTQASRPSIELLLEMFQQNRCLLILDNVETLHRAGDLSGIYKEGFEEYQRIFQSIAETRHRSCLILTSRERPLDLELIESRQMPVRVLKVSGLTSSASQALLTDRGLFGPAGSWDVFVHYYTGNPLALKIAAGTVRDLFGGDLAAFLREAPVTLHTLNQLLGNQFEHLSALERDILFWLAIEREPVDLSSLKQDFLINIPRNELLAGLLSLLQRSLVERSEQGAVFSLLPVLLEFVTDRLVAQVVEQISHNKLEIITKYALVKSQSIGHVRESQVRMIVQPILLLLERSLSDQAALSKHLRGLVDQIRMLPREVQGYAGSNLVTLLSNLNAHIKGEDFSGLVLRQVYLQSVEAQDSNFSEVEFIDCRFTEPLESISAMTLSPNGTYLAASTYNGHIRVWNLKEGKPVWTVTNASRAWSLTFSPDESMLACSHFHGRVSLWDTSAGRKISVFEGHFAWVHTLAFHPDGRYLATAGIDEQICVWDIPHKKLDFVLKGHSARIWSLAFSGDGKFLASGGDEKNVHIWDFEHRSLFRLIPHTANGLMRVAFHPFKPHLAVCSELDPRINLWDILTGEQLVSQVCRSNGPTSLIFSPDGTILANGGQNGAVELWQLNGDDQLQYQKMLLGHHHSVSMIAFAKSNLLASLSYGEDIKLWNVENGKLLRIIEGFSRLIGANSFNSSGLLLVQGDSGGKVRIWDRINQTYTATFQAHTGPIWAVEFSPDGKIFATAGDDRVIKIWDADTLECLKSFQTHGAQTWCLAFNPAGTVLASGGSPKNIQFWDPSLEMGSDQINLIESADDVWSLAYNLEGTLLASGHSNGVVNLWDSQTSQLKFAFPHGTEPVGSVRFSQDGRRLFSSNNQFVIKAWDLFSGDCVYSIDFNIDGNRTRAAAIGTDGLILATGSGTQTMYIWKQEPGGSKMNHFEFEGHTTRAWGVNFSRDDRWMASSDEEGTTLLIDVQNGRVAAKIIIDRPYERMNIHSITGLNPAERAALKALGAVSLS